MITRLQANLPNSALATDFAIDTTPLHPSRNTVYTPKGVRFTIAARAMCAAGILVLLGAWRYASCGSRKARWITIAATAVLAVAGAAATAGVTYLLLPQADIIKMKAGGGDTKAAMRVLQARLEEREMSLQEVQDFFRNALANTPNPVTGEPLAFEEGPGDLVVTQDKSGIAVVVFDGSRGGYPGLPSKFPIKERTSYMPRCAP